MSTLDKQEHYFGKTMERDEFEGQLESIARSTRNAEAYYRALQGVLAGLEEGHTALVGSATIGFAYTIPPVALLELPEGIVVAGVAPGFQSGGLEPGDLIVSVGERPTAEVLDEMIAITAGSTVHGRRTRAVAHLLAGPTGEPAQVRVIGVDGEERACFPLRFLLEDRGVSRQRFGFLPEHVLVSKLDAATVYVMLPDFEPNRPDELFAALEKFREMPTLVLDLRGNPGGHILSLQRIAALFFPGHPEILRLRVGRHMEPVHAAEAPFQFEGEVRVLIDCRTGSAAELLAAALRDGIGAKLIGRTTAGSTRARRAARLPGGVSLYYASQAEFQRRDGGRVEGVGVAPDIHFLPTREQLADGDFGNSGADPAVRHAATLQQTQQ